MEDGLNGENGLVVLDLVDIMACKFAKECVIILQFKAMVNIAMEIDFKVVIAVMLSSAKVVLPLDLLDEL